MSGSCRTPKIEPISQYNKLFHETLRRGLIPPEALKQIQQLEAQLKAKDEEIEKWKSKHKDACEELRGA